ncbi:prolyl oligopeptidase family serine peptidase [Kitasatospora sp. NPDC127116]|uniref:S9 family peptidase n=1 Tax=Kitasatospora sp. NPDC127116 TaxID=3345367 RepID=UPI0036386C9D
MTGKSNEPLDAEWVARKHTTYDELTSADGELWWIQSDPDLGGTRRLMRARPQEKAHPQTPPELSLGGWLHAYGGGAYAVTTDRQWIISAEDSKIYELADVGAPRPIVPADDRFLYGDLHLADGNLLAVRGNDHGDEIVKVDTDGQSMRALVSSSGFLAAPRCRSGLLAYLEWDCDRMPWDSSRLQVTDLPEHGPAPSPKLVAGGEEESVVQPAWGPDGMLYFLSDRTGWWNLYRWDGLRVHAVAPMDADCAPAPWEGGYQSFGFLPGGEIVLTVSDGFRTRLITVGGDGHCREQEADVTSVKPYVAVLGQQVALIASTPTSTPSIRVFDPASPIPAWRWNFPTPMHEQPQYSCAAPTIREVRSSSTTIRYLLHRPLVNGPVPLLVRAHPGPTDDVPMRLDWTVQYFVARGFAVAEVAYRGSTGQGRQFRQALHGHWGEFDVEDCAAVAQQLLADGTALRGAVFISGASAGGYTALQAACLTGPFTGATATSAIIDPKRWTITAPRFQRPHAAVLAGPVGAVRAEAIRVPVLLVHGTSDDIATVADARRLAAELQARGADHETLFLEGGDHYLSVPESRRAVLEAELRFFQRITPVGVLP